MQRTMGVSCWPPPSQLTGALLGGGDSLCVDPHTNHVDGGPKSFQKFTSVRLSYLRVANLTHSATTEAMWGGGGEPDTV